jgi:hypothetical protein
MICRIGTSEEFRYKLKIASSKHSGRLLDYRENEEAYIKRMQRNGIRKLAFYYDSVGKRNRSHSRNRWREQFFVEVCMKQEL